MTSRRAARTARCRAVSSSTVALAIVLTATASTAHGDPATTRRRAIHAGAIVIGGTLFAIASTTLDDRLAPETCRWCDPPGFDRGARDALIWDNTGDAGVASDAFGYVAAPAIGFGLLAASSQSAGRWFDDAVPVAEAMLVSSAMTAMVKIAVGRQRPFVRFAGVDHVPSSGDNLSFYSGHTSFAFSASVAAGVVASRRGYRLAPLIWTGGLTFAAATGYLRIAADKHYASDVIAGALGGAAVGVAVPVLLHDLCVVPARDGIAIAGRF